MSSRLVASWLAIFAVPRSAILAAVLGLAAVAGCSEEGAPSQSDGAGALATETSAGATEDKVSGAEAGGGTAGGGTTGGKRASAVTLAVTADKTHAVQPNDEIRIEVTVEGFVLDAAAIGGEAQPGAGHYHVYLGDPDGEPLLVSAETSAVVKIPADVTDGTHTLRIQLRHHDHSPLDPPVEAGVRLIIYRL